MIHALRCAQRTNDPKGVAKAMSFMSGRNKILPAIVVQEIAFARIEKDNELTYTALKTALTTFDDSVSKSLEISLLNSDSKESSGGIEEHKSRPRTPAKKSGKKSRRYSMANMNRADIDLESIDISSLDEGMEAARTHGLFTFETKQLFRTVSIIKLLRLAMKANDWPRVEEILQEIAVSESSQGKLHELATNELLTIEKQLEMRTSIVDLSKSLKIGWARCTNGIVDTQKMQINSLIDAIRRAEKSMQDLGLSKDLQHAGLEYSTSTGKGEMLSAITFKDIKYDVSELSPSLNILRNASLTTTLPSLGADCGGADDDALEMKSKVHQQVERLLLSAAVAVDVRKALHECRIQHAGAIAEMALQSKCIHENVAPELQHYATEIGRALNMMRLCDQLRDGIKNGDSKSLKAVIKESKESKVCLSDDLGLLRTLEKAEAVFKAISGIERSLRSISAVHDTVETQRLLEKASDMNVTGPLVDNAIARLATLHQFKTGIADLNIQSGGMVTGKAAQQMVCDLSTTLDVVNHPVALRAKVLLQLNNSGFSRAMIAESCSSNNAFSAATETIKYKRSLLKNPDFQELYHLEKFERLRDPLIFTMRLALQYKEQKHTMLRYSDSTIGTSLTMLSPLLATLAVFIFTHIVKVIDENASSCPEVLLRNVISIGRSCPLLRDEILLQCVKQLRSNPNEESECRMWYLLRACTKFFPPSNYFENYLECFLLSCINARTDTRSHLAHQCIRCMHESIFHYGYNNKIFSPWDSSLNVMKLWLSAVAPKDDAEDDDSSSTRRLSMSKPLTINSKTELYYGSIDPSFVQGSVSALLPISKLRGTRENWIYRFTLLKGKNEGVSMSEFAGAVFAKPLRMDFLDREVLMFWLSGNFPPLNVVAQLLTGVESEHSLFISHDGEEEYRGIERRRLLSNLPTSAPRKLTTMDAKGEALAVFFETVEHCMLQDKALLNMKSMEALRERRKRASFMESSDTIVEVEDEIETVLTWQMYRDIVFVGMEKIIENLS